MSEPQDSISVDMAKCCAICGKNHPVKSCDFLNITRHVLDKPIPSQARLTLPDFLKVECLNDGSFITKTQIDLKQGIQFGPFHAEKVDYLDYLTTFPLKLFTNDTYNGYYLLNTNEKNCNWLFFVGVAEFSEEQNLICYQEKGQVYYVTSKCINAGDILRVWYSPYYATQMNKSLLPSRKTEENGEVFDINDLIMSQQNIIERKSWTCKFCSHIEYYIVPFAKHILKHYLAQNKNFCEICNKTFGSKKYLNTHLKIVHGLNNSSTKYSKKVEVNVNKTLDSAVGGPLLNDLFTDSSDLQQPELNQFDLNIDNHNLLLDNENLAVENFINENVKDLDHFNFEIDDNQKQYVCDICLKQFVKVKLLITHLHFHTGEFICTKCLKIFCRKENLNTHICNAETYHQCPVCHKQFLQKKIMNRHYDAIHKKKFSCVSCKRHYFSTKELLEHNCTNTPSTEKELFSCTICDKNFFRALYLKRHMKTHLMASNKTSVTCEICGVQLQNKNSYYNHIKTHQPASYDCPYCDKQFPRLDSLKEHLSSHSLEMPFECTSCKRRFKTRKVLVKHALVHGADSPEECRQCKKLFKTKCSLERHKKAIHLNNKNKKTSGDYTCPTCNKVIKLRSSLLRHMRNSHGVSTIDKDIIKSQEKNSKSQESRSDYLKGHSDNARSRKIPKNKEDKVQKIKNTTKIKNQDVTNEVCLSIPELGENFGEITLDKNAYILDNGTIVQPQEDPNDVVLYLLD